MTRPESVYWKRCETTTETTGRGVAISGWCPATDVPPHGVVDDRALPTDLARETDSNGTLRLISPPVFGKRYAYRLIATVAESRRDVLSTGSFHALRQLTHAERIEAPQPGTRRTNWWWAHHDGYWRHCGSGAPIRLLRKWTGPMLDVLTQDHDRRDEILSQWADLVKAHASDTKRRRPEGAAGPRKTEGTPVVARAPIAFQSDTLHQHFVLDRHDDRGRLYPFFRNVRMKVPHGSMLAVTRSSMADRDLTAHLGNLAGYIATAHAAGLALKAAMPRSAHELRAFTRTWQPVISDWASRPMAEYADGRPGGLSAADISAAENGLSLLHAVVADILAAERAASGQSDVRGPVSHFALEQLLGPAQSIIKTAKAACPEVAEAE